MLVMLEEVVRIADYLARQSFLKNGSVEEIMYLLFDEESDKVGLLTPDDPLISFSEDNSEQVRDAMEKLQPYGVVHVCCRRDELTEKVLLITYGVDFGPHAHAIIWEILQGPKGSSLVAVKADLTPEPDFGSWLRILMATTRH